jgi:2-polyprenyl-3-methyl-5-hydroxy-6-metoxy-1,4-benzoquinol methylase
LERRLGKDLSQIPADHRNRYFFARDKLTGRVLDAACGCGYGSAILNEKCVTVGVDIHPPAIEHAKQYYPGPEYLCGDICSRPWHGKFSGIVSFETLEHLKDPRPVLDEFRASLKGLLICSVPNEITYPFVAEVFKNDEFPHYRHYTPSEFDELLICSGFIVESRHSNSKHDPVIRDGTEGQFLVYICS